MLQSNIGFVKQVGSFWDSTQWEVAPRPFLDCQSLAYAMAMNAWIRDEPNPEWADQLPSDVKRPMRKSLKYLFKKTDDSFFQLDSARRSSLNQSQTEWSKLAASDSPTKQVIAIRHLEFDESLNQQQEALILKKLQTRNRAVLLHAIEATQRLKNTNEPIADELRLLVQHREDEVRAKALCALTRLGMLDELTVELAAKMLDGNARFVVFSGVFALSSLDSVPTQVLPSANRGLIRALQTCDYEFVGLFAAAFNRWLDDPENHLENLLKEDSPEYLEIALEGLQNVRDQMVALG